MIYNIIVKSVLIYRAETWSLYEDDRRRINATEMDPLRRSARISKLDRKIYVYICVCVCVCECVCIYIYKKEKGKENRKRKTKMTEENKE